jgi:F-type H+-transporting ATPase subunit b
VLTAVVIRHGVPQLEVKFVAAEEGEEFNPEDCEFKPEDPNATECDEGPSPIMPEVKELAWGAGAFIVFALLMRFVLFPRLKRGMDARYDGIRTDLEGAEQLTASARTEVADYEAQLAAVRAEANARVDAARATLEAERQTRLAAVNAGINERRAAALADIDAARAAARSQIESAVTDVAARAGELATGKRPDAAVVSAAVRNVMGAGVRS